MIEIDGAFGEGGGQIIRSSLALSALTGKPFRIENIRAGRKKPGLKLQHVTAVEAAARICNAKIDGAEIGSSTVTFEPQQIVGGHYEFKIRTAGSVTLVAQTVLPALMLAEQPSTLTFEGGTHNPWAPPFDFLERSFLPLLNKFGPKVSANLERPGFFPNGGGRFTMQVEPCSQLKRGLELLERGDALKPKVIAMVSSLPRHVGERECDTIRRKASWSPNCCEIIEVEDPRGPGNVVMIELASKNVTAIFSGFGRQGVKAEHVGRDVYRQAKPYLDSDFPVEEYLADQLMMPMGLAASHGHTSRFRTEKLSDHSTTHIEILKTFLDIHIEVTEESEENVVKFSPQN